MKASEFDVVPAPVRKKKIDAFSREGKASFSRKRCLAVTHGPPRPHEPRFSVSAMPNLWPLTNCFSLHTLYFTFILGTGYNQLACGRAGTRVGPV